MEELNEKLNQALRRAKEECGLEYKGKNKEGDEVWLGRNDQWRDYYAKEGAIYEEFNDPPEGSVFHPDYNKDNPF